MSKNRRAIRIKPVSWSTALNVPDEHGQQGQKMTENRSEREYLRAAEAAAYLKVSPKTVSRWAKEGKLQHIVTLGGHRRFPRAAIMRLAQQLGLASPGEGESPAAPADEEE